MGVVKILKNFIPIYVLTSLIFISLINNGSITFIASANPYSGPDYYVDGKFGNDANDGSFNYPWRTIQYAIENNNVGPGDTVYIMAGVYYEKTITTLNAHSGTLNNWITYTNYNDDKVIIDANGGTYNWGGVLSIDSSRYIRISDLTIRNAPSHGIYIASNTRSCNNIIIDNCTIYNCSESGICFLSVNDIIVENNIIYDTENGWNNIGEPSQESITLANCNRFRVQQNIMFENGKINIDAKAGSKNGIIDHNRIISSRTKWSNQWGPSGIYVDAENTNCNNISIYDNLVRGTGPGYIVGTELGGTLDDITIYNNIYYGTGNAFQINDHTNIPGSHLKTNLKYLNNMAGGGTTICFQITDKNTSFRNLTVRNCIFDGRIGFNLAGGLKLDYQNVDHNLFYISGYSDYYGRNSINGSPCFVNPAMGDFSLSSKSPAINNGSSVDAPSFDLIGVKRPQGSKVDIGAYEFISNKDTTIRRLSDLFKDKVHRALGWLARVGKILLNFSEYLIYLLFHQVFGMQN